ncbi:MULTISPECIES: PRANC domain-containing protein [unclassified Wolbachia]|uniref:PRANC domain-containing protein n=1 Tax=unclassified Wolbachia TaxID=2640676 RepID=UPI00222644D1|nr:PRANC domain-containing protein [Wolbachia endosymbiont (group B) of Euphydryas aurinia]
MKGGYFDVVRIFHDLDQCENLDATNVIEKIKRCLQEKAGNLYSSWKEGNFDINHKFLLLSGSGRKEQEFSLIDIALYNCYDGNFIPKLLPRMTHFYNIAKALIRAGAEIHNALDDLRCCILTNRTDVVKFLIKEILIKNPDDSIPDLLRHNNTMLEYWNKCSEEIKRIKEEKIGNGITFYDVLAGNNDQLACHIRVAGAALNEDKHKKFPIYANEIENQRQKLWERLELIGEGSNNLCKVFPSSRTESDKELPKELSKRVVELLSNIDIKNLNEAVRSTYSETTHV